MDYIKFRPLTLNGNAFDEDNGADQAILYPLLELVRTIFAETAGGQDITVEVTLKVTLTAEVLTATN
jgi:hypothetical protein